MEIIQALISLAPDVSERQGTHFTRAGCEREATNEPMNAHSLCWHYSRLYEPFTYHSSRATAPKILRPIGIPTRTRAPAGEPLYEGYQ